MWRQTYTMPPRCRTSWACLALPLVMLACSVPTPPPDESPNENTVVYVIERGWHTDIGLPAEEIAEPLSALKAAFPGARFLTFGFGERQFIMNRRSTLAGMLRALLPSRSVLLMTALQATPEEAFGRPNVVTLHLSRPALMRIEAAIGQELRQANSLDPQLLAPGPYPGSVFFAASDTYYGLYTCNTWTARMLRIGGFPMPVAGVLFSGQVMRVVRGIGARQTHQDHAVSAALRGLSPTVISGMGSPP
jgi:hypothetical protein